MAKSAQEMQAFDQAAKQYLGRGLTGGYDQAFNDSSISLNDRIRELINSDEAKAYAQKQASDQYQPQIGQIDNATAQTKSDLDTLIGQLQKQQQAAPEQTFGDFNRRGLFRSSMAETAVANQQGDFNNKIGNAQIQRSTRLADLASQRAQLLNKQQQYATGMVNQNLQGFNQNVSAQEAAQAKADQARQQQEYQQQLQQMRLQTALAQASHRGGSGSGTGSTILDSWLAGQMGGGQQPQQQQETFNPNETLPDLSTAGPTNPNPVQQGPSILQKLSQPMSLSQQANAVKGYLGNTFNSVANAKVPRSLKGAQWLFGNNLFKKG